MPIMRRNDERTPPSPPLQCGSSQLCPPRPTVIVELSLKCKGTMFQILSHLSPHENLLYAQNKAFPYQGSTCLEVAVVTRTDAVTAVIHLLPPHRTTLHAPRVEGNLQPVFSSLCAFNQRRPAHYLPPVAMAILLWQVQSPR